MLLVAAKYKYVFYFYENFITCTSKPLNIFLISEIQIYLVYVYYIIMIEIKTKYTFSKIVSVLTIEKLRT